MRIESPNRSAIAASKRPARRTVGGGAVFTVDDEAAPARAGGAGAIQASAGIEALIALQAVEDPLVGKRKAVKRGNLMLDALEEIKADLLTGAVPEGRLNRLIAFVGQARDRFEPGLDAALADIELRARVELAKLGRFPAL